MIWVKASCTTRMAPTSQASLEKGLEWGVTDLKVLCIRNSFVYIYSMFTLFLLDFWNCASHDVILQALVMRDVTVLIMALGKTILK